MGRTKRIFGKEADKVFKESGKRRIETALFAAHELGRQQQEIPELTVYLDQEEAKERIWKLLPRLDGDDDAFDTEDRPDPPTKFPSTLVPTMAILDSMCTAIVESLHESSAPPSVPVRIAPRPGSGTASGPAASNVFITQREATPDKQAAFARPPSPRLLEQFAGAREYAQGMHRARAALAQPASATEATPPPQLPARFVRSETQARERVGKLLHESCSIKSPRTMHLEVACEGLPQQTADILEQVLRPRQEQAEVRTERPAMQVAGPAFAAAYDRQRDEARARESTTADAAASQLLLRSASLAARVLPDNVTNAAARTASRSSDAKAKAPVPKADAPAAPLPSRPAKELPPILQQVPRGGPPPEVTALQGCPVRVLLVGRVPGRERRSIAAMADAGLQAARRSVNKIACVRRLTSSKTLAGKMSALASNLQVHVSAPSKTDPTSLRKLQAIAACATPVTSEGPLDIDALLALPAAPPSVATGLELEQRDVITPNSAVPPIASESTV